MIVWCLRETARAALALMVLLCYWTQASGVTGPHMWVRRPEYGIPWLLALWISNKVKTWCLRRAVWATMATMGLLSAYVQAIDLRRSYVPHSQRPTVRKRFQQLADRCHGPNGLTHQIATKWCAAQGWIADCQQLYTGYWTRWRHRNALSHLQACVRDHIASEVEQGSVACFQAVALSASAGRPEGAMPYVFDTDSHLIGLDNRATACMSANVRDFVGPLIETDQVVKGFAGSRTGNVQKGTIEWAIEDDNGRVTTHRIPNSYYIPQGKVRLLSPQHWAAELPKPLRPPAGTPPEATFHDKVILRWGNSTKTIRLDPTTNVASFPLAPAYHRYHDFCTTANIKDNHEDSPVCLPVLATQVDEFEPETSGPAPRPATFDLDGPMEDALDPPVVMEDEEEKQRDNISAEFLRYHHRFGHASPARLQRMAKLGIIPKRLAKCPVPVCTACLHGKATKTKWRHKTANNVYPPEPPKRPGEVVSVDQMISPTPGLVAQLSGRNTKLCYTCATIFVNQASDLSYVHLQKTQTAEETLEAKVAFERYSAEHGVAVQHYHADNGIFKANLWVQACHEKGQGLSFAGVNAHHQNGRTERRIRELQQLARTMLIHAQRRWPTAVTANLWPYALRMANDAINSLPSLKRTDGKSPMSIFARSMVLPNSKHWHHFGCPVYVLAEALQKGDIHHKWKERTRALVCTLADRLNMHGRWRWC
jgi:GAG-pre-integrase domain